MAIEARNLKKHFGKIAAVDGIDIEGQKGSVIALLGPNGAGKTTTVKLLTTQLLPDEGQALVMGYDAAAEPREVRKRIGITFQETCVDEALSGQQVLEFTGELYGLKRRQNKIRTGELLEMVGLSDAARRKTSTYSGGMKRRLELARSLMNTPDVLILDEPTLGLDPQTRKKVWEYLMFLKEHKRMTILLTTHYLDEAEQISDFVYIIDYGKVVKAGKAENLIRELGNDTIRLEGEGDAGSLKDQLGTVAFIQSLSISEDNILHVGVDSGQQRVPQILELAAQSGFNVSEVGIDRPDLGDVFFSAVGREIRE